MKPLTRKAFKALQQKWYGKLEKDGFEDIEYKDGSLKAAHPRNIYSLDPDLVTAKIEYYSLCETFLREHEFASNLERIIWEYHTNGISSRDIAKILVDTKVKKRASKTPIHAVIQRLETIMRNRYICR